MKYKKILSIVTAAVAWVILLIPVVTMNFSGGGYSANEQRYLSGFPISRNKQTGKFETSREAFEDWVNDNIGFRDLFVKAYANIKYKMFGQSSSEKVILGTDGWMFYTGNRNNEIATGEYTVTEEELELIAKNQQAVSDYYKSIGTKYILMLVPSKTSVYSEYMMNSYMAVEKTIIDIVSDYLRENTDVTVYNAKDELLKVKADGEEQLYFKTDTHWNQKGSYYAYRGLHSLMVNAGLISDNPIDVDFSQGKRTGEFSKMLGDPDLLPAEEVPNAEWDRGFSIISEGTQFDSLVKMQNYYSDKYEPILTKKDNAIPLKLRLYGDSFLNEGFYFPYYLAENFGQVEKIRQETISIDTDNGENQDIVIFETTERFIIPRLTAKFNLPDNAILNKQSISSLPQKEQQNTVSYHGMFLDRYNNVKPAQKGEIEIDRNAEAVSLVGWAVDSEAESTLGGVYIKAGDNIIACKYGDKRQGVVDAYKKSGYLRSGFTANFSASLLYDENGELLDSISFILVGHDGTDVYEPVEYKLK